MGRLVFLIAIGVCYNLFISSENGTAQDIENVDSAFEDARNYAFDGDYDQAETLLLEILEGSPDYHDVRLFLARIYSWNERYRESLEQTEYILERESDHYEALDLNITVKLWDDQPEDALQQADRALNHHSTSDTFWLQRARAQLAVENYQAAMDAIEQAERINPSNSDIQSLKMSVRQERQRYTVSVSATHDRYTEIFDPQTLGSVQVSRLTQLGSIIGRVNYANRFGSDGFQAEVDWYPPIRDGVYMYINTGGSNHFLFPSFRGGIEPYFRLPQSFEASAGLRYLNFSGSEVWIYTGSLTHYRGNWMLSLRPFFTPSSDGVSNSYNLSFRRYFADGDTYIGLSGGFGFSPEERFFQDQDEELFFFKSQYGGIEASKKLRYNLTLYGSLSLTRQEMRFDPEEYYLITSANFGVQFSF